MFQMLVKPCAIVTATLFFSGCESSSELIGASNMNQDSFSDESKESNREVILMALSDYSNNEIKDCVSAMEMAEWMAKTNPNSGLNFAETQNLRLFWMEALRRKTGNEMTLDQIKASSDFHLGQAEMSTADSAKFQDGIAKSCTIKVANALRDIGVSTGYEN